MTQSTPNLNLTKPGGGSTGTNTPPDRVDIDVLNDNFDKIDAAVGDPDEQNRQWYGPAAQIGTLPDAPKDGDTYQESDGNKILWRRVGGLWVTNESGAYLIRPSSVVNGSVAADGAIISSGGQLSLSVNGVFSPRFRAYKVIYNLLGLAGSSNALIRFRRAGTDDLTAGCSTQRMYISGTGTAAGAQNLGLPGFDLLPVTSTILSGEFVLLEPASGNTKTWYGKSLYFASTPGVMDYSGGVTSAPLNVAFDGFTLIVTAALNAGSYLKVYGLA